MTDYKQKALLYAEQIGVYEYTVDGHMMCYWSFFGSEGWLFVIYDLKEEREVFRGGNIPWMGFIPGFLKDPVTGGTLYNYFCG